jgi:hypothetical protein
MSDTITTGSFIIAAEDDASNVILSKTASSHIKYMNILQTAATKLSHDKSNTVNNTATATMTTNFSSVENCAPNVNDSETLLKKSKLNISIPEPSSDNPVPITLYNCFCLILPNFVIGTTTVTRIFSIVTASGFTLVSRATPIDQAMKAILHGVASDKIVNDAGYHIPLGIVVVVVVGMPTRLQISKNNNLPWA